MRLLNLFFPMHKFDQVMEVFGIEVRVMVVVVLGVDLMKGGFEVDGDRKRQNH